jgi:hypothetical protein
MAHKHFYKSSCEFSLQMFILHREKSVDVKPSQLEDLAYRRAGSMVSAIGSFPAGGRFIELIGEIQLVWLN